MSIWILIQVIVNIFLIVGVTISLIKAFKAREDDPRLTQGLRLLQSKISILEDLSDHTENQVKQLMTLLDKKLHEVRSTINQVNEHIGEVDKSIEKSQRMAEMIQNEIPHDKITEKRLENRYIQAAHLAHQGLSVDDIMAQVDLPRAEIELIAKVNKKSCVYQVSDKSAASIEEGLFSRSLQMPEIS
ncbi:MAG: DUF2802 domain-containing protein, partial [Pseudomonadota bacterium]